MSAGTDDDSAMAVEARGVCAEAVEARGVCAEAVEARGVCAESVATLRTDGPASVELGGLLKFCNY
jgi:sulfur relay (sulfurtransferase) complex TusBCD TusD component (DsrE family)